MSIPPCNLLEYNTNPEAISIPHGNYHGNFLSLVFWRKIVKQDNPLFAQIIYKNNKKIIDSTIELGYILLGRYLSESGAFYEPNEHLSH
jgi:hypothetical protein